MHLYVRHPRLNFQKACRVILKTQTSCHPGDISDLQPETPVHERCNKACNKMLGANKFRWDTLSTLHRADASGCAVVKWAVWLTTWAAGEAVRVIEVPHGLAGLACPVYALPTFDADTCQRQRVGYYLQIWQQSKTGDWADATLVGADPWKHKLPKMRMITGNITMRALLCFPLKQWDTVICVRRKNIYSLQTGTLLSALKTKNTEKF